MKKDEDIGIVTMKDNVSKNDTGDALIICRCEGVGLDRIRDAIDRSGAETVNQIKKMTRAGMGPCQGRTCARAVESILASASNLPAGREAFRSRPPVRGVSLETLAAGHDQFDEPAGPVSTAMTRKRS